LLGSSQTVEIPDKFKVSLSAYKVCEAIAKGIL
jgi:glycerate kinase